MASTDQTIIGTTVDNYQVTAVLGRGGMGVVYKARNIALEKDVALKVMDTNLARDESFLKRFKAEAKSLAMLQNPNIVTVYDLRDTPLGVLIVMEFVDGVTLADKIRAGGALPLSEVLPLFKQLLAAMDHAHAVGVIHRDIKPSNIMVAKDGTVKVTDFGLAKIQRQSSDTLTMASGGTLRYMPPEQIRGLSEVDHRGDIYSLGMTLYETVAGRLPFNEGESDYDISAAIVEGKIPRPDQINRSITKDLTKIVLKAIAKDPADRYQSAGEMQEALERVERELRPTIPRAETRERTPARFTWTTTHKFIVAAIASVLLACCMLVYLTYFTPVYSSMSIATAPAGASVELNGKPAGTTPIAAMRLDPGIVRLRVRLAGYKEQDSVVTLTEGARLSVLLALAKLRDSVTIVPTLASAKLGLRAIPAGSVVVDSEQKSGQTGRWDDFEIEPGYHTITFSRSPGISKTIEVTLQPGETRNVTCYFESYVSILAKPVWASIIIDGKDIGKVTPQASIPLGVGKHRISVSRMGYELIDGAQRVDVSPTLEKREIPLVFNLQKN